MAKKLNPRETQDRLDARDQVAAIDEQATGWKNLLSLKREANKAAKEELSLRNQIAKLGREQAIHAIDYKNATDAIKDAQKELIKAQASGDKRRARDLKAEILAAQRVQAEQKKTAGGALMSYAIEARQRKTNLSAERQLIKEINKERSLSGKVMDLFRTKEARQRQIDIARAKVGGGVNKPPGTGGKSGSSAAAGGGGGKSSSVSMIAGPWGVAAIKAAKALVAPIKAVGEVAKDALTAPFADAAGLLTGEDVGMGGGKLKTGGASSILGGLEKVASSIPVIGGLLGGLVGIFKTLIESVHGLEQADFRAARALNLSVGATQKMRDNFQAMVASSSNLALNSTRMMEAEIAIGNQLGINKQVRGDILENAVLLKDVLGLEAESVEKINETSYTTGKNAAKLTQSLIGTVGAFNKIVGTSFTFNSTLQQVSKIGGIIGLTFSKYPEKITKAFLTTKTLGMELEQVQGIASGFLDFESSISKEMEAQVLTGREMNLTKAREAALNNDYVTLTQEIAKNVGNSTAFLKLNRIQQEGIAESVGMTANSLADVLRKQELYAKVNATDAESFKKKLGLLEKQGKLQQQISDLIGKDAYNEYTRLSTAEKISEVMEKIKITFMNFVKTSGLFDFITNPARVNSFIKSAVGMLAGAVDTIGDIIAGILDVISHIPFTDKEKWQGMAAQVRGGVSDLSGGIRTSVANLGGQEAPGIGQTVQSGARQQQQQASVQPAAMPVGGGNLVALNQGNVYLDRDKVGSILFGNASQQYSLKTS